MPVAVALLIDEAEAEADAAAERLGAVKEESDNVSCSSALAEVDAVCSRSTATTNNLEWAARCSHTSCSDASSR